MEAPGAARALPRLLARPEALWLAVALGVSVLLWLKLVLFAAALPLMAYWHCNRAEDAVDGEPEVCDGADADADLDAPWLPEDEEAEADDDCVFPADADRAAPPGAAKEDGDPYDRSFWSADGAEEVPKRNAPWRNTSRAVPPTKTSERGADNRGAGAGPPDLDELPMPKPLHTPGDAGGAGGELDWGDLAGAPRKAAERGAGVDELLGGGGDADFLGGLGLGLGLGLGDEGGDDDLFGLMSGGRGKGKGKGKGKGGDKGGPRDPLAPREPNPKQVFVANVGDLAEEDIRAFFEDVGEVDRLKVLRNPDGGSKGVCFVTFRTEEQAQKALGLHGTSLEGKSLVVRLAHGGNKGGDKGGEKGGGFKGGGPERGGGLHEGLPDFGGSERFGPAFGDGERERGDRGPGFGKGRGGKGAGGGRRMDRGEMDELLEEALADSDGPIKPGDFDFAARRFLQELRGRDRSDGTDRFQKALDMVLKYTSSKDRSSVRKWPAYIFTLLQKFDPNLWEELRERDAERRREKGGGGYGAARERRPMD